MTISPIVLCIPRMECAVPKDYILQIFQKLKIGKIDSIQEIPLHNGTQYKRIIVKVHWNLQNIRAQNIHKRLSQDKSIKIVHSMPWYWLCVKYIKHTAKLQGPNPDMMSTLL
jgi:hypothetical protein